MSDSTRSEVSFIGGRREGFREGGGPRKCERRDRRVISMNKEEKMPLDEEVNGQDQKFKVWGDSSLTVNFVLIYVVVAGKTC